MPKFTLVGHEHVIESIQWIPEKFTEQVIASDQPKEKEGKNIKNFNVYKLFEFSQTECGC
jgi:hypothetical protein